MILATDKQVITLLVKSHPVTGAIKLFLTADGKGVADETGSTLLGSSVIALHDRRSPSVKKPLLAGASYLSALSVNGHEVGVGARFADWDRRGLIRGKRLHFVVSADVGFGRSVEVRVTRVRKFLHQCAEVLGRENFAGEEYPTK